MKKELKDIKQKLSYIFIILGAILVIIYGLRYLSSCSLNISVAMLIGLVFVAIGYLMLEK